jgi:hypothetical protein
MSSREFDAKAKTRWSTGVLFRLLDPAFGFFVWAAHFLAVYIAAALACALSLDAASPGARTALTTALALATGVAAAIVVVHGVRRYRQQRDVPKLRFRLTVTAGCDAIGTVAIAWQMFPILLVPACA